MAIYGYIRTDEEKQKKDLSYQEQETLIRSVYPEAIIIKELSTVSSSRHNLDLLLNSLKKDDMIICTKLNQFCSEINKGIEDIQFILENGCALHILYLGLIDMSEQGKSILKQLKSLAEFRKDTLIERCQEGKELARLNPDFKEGRPAKYSEQDLDAAINLLSEKSYREVALQTGISVSTLHRHRKKHPEKI